MTPLLSLRHVETWYGRIQALGGVSIDVEEGSITVILGNNGAGKTTVLATVAGLLDGQPEKGAILFDGARIDGVKTERLVSRGIGCVLEGRQVFPELTVAENFQVGAYLRRDRDRVRQDLEWVHQLFPVLLERRSQLAGTLSGGEQQMLAIGRAVMTGPRLLMMDEPSLGLSPLLVDRVFAAIERVRERGVTILLVEQNARKALEVADQGYVVEDGRVVASGTSAQLRDDADVREFYLGAGGHQMVAEARRWKRRKRWR